MNKETIINIIVAFYIIHNFFNYTLMVHDNPDSNIFKKHTGTPMIVFKSISFISFILSIISIFSIYNTVYSNRKNNNESSNKYFSLPNLYILSFIFISINISFIIGMYTNLFIKMKKIKKDLDKEKIKYNFYFEALIANLTLILTVLLITGILFFTTSIFIKIL